MSFDEFIGICNHEIHIEKNKQSIYLDTFSYKGCWNCQYFKFNINNYMFVNEASKIYGVSESTIRNWCKNRRIEAQLCKRTRYDKSEIFLGSNKIWLIKR